jgi:hypothetical protein
MRRDVKGERKSYSSLFRGLGLPTLESNTAALALQPLRGYQPLDFWCLGIGFLALAFGLYFAADNEFTDL